MNMEKQQRLYVFNRNEVALLFLFLIVIALLSFVLGVKIGKSFSYQQAGLTPQDQINVELKSGQEEMVNSVVKNSDQIQANREQVLDSTYKRLEKEFNKLEEKKDIPKDDVVAMAQENDGERVEEVDAPKSAENNAMIDMESDKTITPTKKDEYSGKYSIQLGSHRSKEDAEKFADGFRVRGYDLIIINEVELKGRGTWYRVSLGVFDSFQDAKAFFLKEQSLFKGMDEPYIVKFK